MKLVVVGGGPGGYVAAIKAAMLGAEVTLIEKENMGGTCLNVGCIPTKALIACSETVEYVEVADKFGVNIEGEAKLDFKYMFDRKDKIVKQLVSGIEYLLDQRGVKVIRGFGKLLSNKLVEVTKKDGSKETVEADKIIIATGSIPVVPGFFKYDGKTVITSDEVLNLKKLPESIVIVGGGPIGCEIGQFFAKIGTDVKIVEMVGQLVPTEDEDVAKILQRSFKMDKIKFFVGDSIKSVEIKDGKVYSGLGSGKILETELMLVCVGRKPNIAGLGLEELGVALERGKVIVNEKLETNLEGVYAIGDVINTPALAHVASKEGIVAVLNAFGKEKKMSYKAFPRCVFTSPEISSVGVTEKQLKDANIDYKVGKFDFRGLGKAQAIGKLQGFVKVITDMDNKIIGAAIIGAHASDLLAELTLAVQFGLTSEQVGDVIHPHPTLSEAIMEALHDVNNESVHSAKK
jgi:dihydrolipoamide dehydrogenase